MEVLGDAQSLVWITLFVRAGASREVPVRQARQRFGGRPGPVFFLGLLPLLEQGLEVPFEYRGPVVAGVELADVLDSAEV